MGELIKAVNSFDKRAQYSFLTSATITGANVIPWDNNSAFRASWAIQLGQTGQEKTEILVLGTATPAVTQGTTVGTALYPHDQDTPIYSILYDKLIFKRSTSGTSAAATAIPGGTVGITPDSIYTTYYDTDGADSYFYRVVPYNSVLDIEGVTSDWLSAGGYDFYSLRKIRERTKNKLHSSSFIQDDEVLNDWTNEWLETMNNAAVQVNKDYSLGTTSVAVGTSGIGTITDEDYKDVRKIEFTYDGTNYFVCTRMELVDFEQNQVFLRTHPYFYFMGDNVFGIKAGDVAGTALIHYYKGVSVMSNDTDSLPVVMRPYSKSFVDYNRAQAAYLDNDDKMGDRFMVSAEKALEDFKKQITPRHRTGTKYIDFVETVDGENSSMNFYY